jgi:hypothetical protein
MLRGTLDRGKARSRRAVAAVFTCGTGAAPNSLNCARWIGSSVAAVEASWYAHTFSQEALTRWAPPLFRATIALGPILIATMAMSNQIPLSYALTCLVLPPITQVLRRTKGHATIPSTTLTGAAGIYLLFLTIMTVCAWL